MTRPVTDVIRELNGGAFAEEITQELAKLVPECRACGTAGELTISLKLKPGRAGSAAFEIVPSYKVKQPKREIPTEIFFATSAGALVRDNPDQKKLNLVDVSIPVTTPGAAPLREVVDPSTGEILSGAPRRDSGAA